MKYIIVVISTYVFTQILKFIFRLFSKDKNLNKNFIWVFLFATGAPSAHSAVLTSGLYLLYLETGFDAIFAFATLVSVIFMYNLVADREREKIREMFLRQGDEFDRNLVSSGKVMDISGHTFFDVISGIMVGLIATYIFLNLL